MPLFEINIFGLHLSPSWYGLMYAVSFLIGFFLIRKQFDEGNTDTIFFATILGVILGGRLGYVFFYNPVYYFDHFYEIFMPWRGGMSFHGGAIGVIIAWYIAARKMKTDFLQLSDRLVWIVPIGIFFGRIGNYINGELLGIPGYNGWLARTIDGMTYFPTPLLEASLEGIVLFLILIWKKKKIQYAGQVGVWFLGWYGVFRFVAEFFRSPDAQIGYLFGGWMTIGHIFSLGMISIALVLSLSLQKRK